jgi:hypothetical protein
MKHTLLISVFFLAFAYSKTARELCSGTAEKASDGN